RESIGYHDALGSNLWLHTRRGEVLRTVPRENEAVNECWLSDRDRYSCEGLYASDRALHPAIKRNGDWIDVDWSDALAHVAEKLKGVEGAQIGALVQPGMSCEEGVLLARVMRFLGSPNVDHRLRALDLSDHAVATPFEMAHAQLDRVDAALLIGCDPRAEMPLLNHRLREANKHGAKIFAINPAHFDFNYPLAGETVVPPQALLHALLRLAKAAGVRGDDQHLSQAVATADPGEHAQAMTEALQNAASKVIVFGHIAARHPQASLLRALAKAIAQATGAAFNEIPDGANAVGLARFDVLPGDGGLNAQAMFAQPRKAYLLYGAEPPHDFADSAQTMKALRDAECVIAFSAFASKALLEVADVILPIGLAPETDGTYVNLDGTLQSCSAGAILPGGARAGWRVLRALGGLLDVHGFDFTEITQVRKLFLPPLAGKPPSMAGELRGAEGGWGAIRAEPSSRGAPADWEPFTAKLPHDVRARALPGEAQTMPDFERHPLGVTPPDVHAPQSASGALVRLATVPIYRSDAVVRRSAPLQAHPLNRAPALRLHAEDATALNLVDGGNANVNGVVLLVVVDNCVARGSAWIETAHELTAALPPYGSTLTIGKSA
ncbi:MAG: molybdopterin-dependent oxidoreductase, partial [Bryobacteraceae bacterium]